MYSSQILATVDGHPIPSYNIGGRTCVVIEDLAYYGFRVVWDPENGIISAVSADVPANYAKYAATARGKGSSIVGAVYETKIVARVNNLPVTSYNIGGYTCVCIEELGDLAGSPSAAYGYSKYYMNAQWDPEKGIINLGTFRITPDSENPIVAAGLNYGCVYTAGADYGTVSFGTKAYYSDFRGAINRVLPLYYVRNNGTFMEYVLAYASPFGVHFVTDLTEALIEEESHDYESIAAVLRNEPGFETITYMTTGEEAALYGAYVYGDRRVYSLRVIDSNGNVIELLDDLWEIDAVEITFPCTEITFNRTRTSLLFSLSYGGRLYHYEFDFLTGELDRID